MTLSIGCIQISGLLMILTNTQCCAVQEISDLSYHKTAKEAMKTFCDEVGYFHQQRPAAFYIFTAVVRQPRSKPTYGQRFAELIRRNKLGELRESVARPNRLNHPNHLVKVWIWAPNERNLWKWDRRN